MNFEVLLGVTSSFSSRTGMWSEAFSFWRDLRCAEDAMHNRKVVNRGVQSQTRGTSRPLNDLMKGSDGA